MAVVKANAYGHGAVPVAKALESVGVDWFGVFTPEEGIALRQGGVLGNILVFCRFNRQFLPKAMEWNLTLNITSEDDLMDLKEFHAATGSSPAVHIKIDTGMTRLGLPVETASSFFKLSVMLVDNQRDDKHYYTPAAATSTKRLDLLQLVISLQDTIQEDSGHFR